MIYSQKPLLDLMKAGKFPGESGEPEHIETVISNVFLFKERAYKLYKNNNDFFNKSFRDISGKAERFSFTKKDFEWNNILSPTIYLNLTGVSIVNNEFKVSSSDENSEELLMVMNRVDTKELLFEKLMNGEITESDCFTIGKQFADGMIKVQKKLSGHNFYELYRSRIVDLRDWIKSISEFISEEESGKYCDFLEGFRVKNKDWFENELSNQIVTDGDFHSNNVLFSKGILYFMDTFTPKEEWGRLHYLISLYRVGTDIWALSGKKEFFEAYIKGYEEGSNRIVDRRLDDLYIVDAASVMVSYLYMLQRTNVIKKEPVERFHKFLIKYFEDRNLSVSKIS